MVAAPAQEGDHRSLEEARPCHGFPHGAHRGSRHPREAGTYMQREADTHKHAPIERYTVTLHHTVTPSDKETQMPPEAERRSAHMLWAETEAEAEAAEQKAAHADTAAVEEVFAEAQARTEVASAFASATTAASASATYPASAYAAAAPAASASACTAPSIQPTAPILEPLCSLRWGTETKTGDPWVLCPSPSAAGRWGAASRRGGAVVRGPRCAAQEKEKKRPRRRRGV